LEVYRYGHMISKWECDTIKVIVIWKCTDMGTSDPHVIGVLM